MNTTPTRTTTTNNTNNNTTNNNTTTPTSKTQHEEAHQTQNLRNLFYILCVLCWKSALLALNVLYACDKCQQCIIVYTHCNMCQIYIRYAQKWSMRVQYHKSQSFIFFIIFKKEFIYVKYWKCIHLSALQMCKEIKSFDWICGLHLDWAEGQHKWMWMWQIQALWHFYQISFRGKKIFILSK